MNVLGVDVSHWQPAVDWGLLYGEGVRFAVVKAAQGSYSRDAGMVGHAMGAAAAGMLVGLYGWHDPNCSPEAEADNFLKAIDGVAFDFLALDDEQYWEDWGEWQEGRITKFVPGAKISESSRRVVELLKKETWKPVVVYTRASFVHEYAPQMASWLKGEDLWLAHYPYPIGRVSTSWGVLKEKLLPKIEGPAKPTGCKDWQLWQFSGDKFLLPGVSTAVDLNFFNGNLKGMREWLGLPVEGVIEDYNTEEKVRILWENHPELWKM